MPISMPNKVKGLFIGYDTILRVFQALTDDTALTLTHVPRLKGVPSTAKILSVHNDPLRRGFQFMVEDASFEEVSLYEVPPELEPIVGAYVEDIEHPVLVTKDA